MAYTMIHDETRTQPAEYADEGTCMETCHFPGCTEPFDLDDDPYFTVRVPGDTLNICVEHACSTSSDRNTLQPLVPCACGEEDCWLSVRQDGCEWEAINAVRHEGRVYNAACLGGAV